MDATPENSTLQIKDPESQSSWVPSTPAKPALVKVQSTYTEKQEQPLQVNWSQQTLPCEGNALDERRIEGIAIGFPQEIEVQNVARCCGESNLVTVDRNSDNCEATAAENTQFYADTVSIYNEFSMENASNVPFKELLALADAAKEFLALADAAGTAKSPEKASNHTALNAESRSSALEFTHFQTTSTSTSSSLENQGHSLESRLYSVPVTPNRGIAGFSGLSFDLNSPPRTLADTGSSAGISSQFAPITPDQVQKTDKEKVSSMPDLCTGGAAKETDVQKEVIMIAELSEPQNDQAQLVENQSCATISSVIGENFKPEMGSDQQRDTSKTPLQKSRRRKHRPKVVVEGQSRTSRNPRTSKPAGPEEVVTPKRKYVRKNTISKPVDTPLEGNTNGIDAGAKSPGSEALPKTKRKYVRRKVVEQSTTPLEKNAKPTDSMAAQVTQRSCKKSLNFDFESQVPDERSTQATTDLNAKSHSQVSIPQDQSTSTMNLVQEMEVMVEKKEADIAYDLTKSMNHALEGYLVVKESQARCSSTSFMSNQLHDKSVVGNQNHCTSGKCQIVFSDATHDKEASIFRIITSDARCATRSSSKSNCSSSACLTQETQARGSKRRQFSTNDESESCSINAAGAQYNSLQAYQDIFPQNEYNREGTPNMHFPAIFKKKRTETMYKSETSSMLPTSSTTNNYGRHGAYHCNDTQKKDFTSEITFRITAAHCDACSRPTTADCTQAEPISKCLPTLRNAETPTKKRSKGPIRVRDFASLHEFSWQMPTSSRRGMPSSRVLQEAHTCMDALVTDTRARLTTKKRSKRNYVASASPNTYNPYQSATMLMGPPPTIMWKNTSSIDAIVEQFNCLDIKAKCNQFSSPEQNALVTYQVDYPWQNSIVVYQSNGTMVPFDAPFNHMRKRRPRPKVDLDDETNRVWKLLLEDINNDGIDGTDQQKAKWWEEERQVFRGRTNSFIARMHLVQGDRRFTPWKGSVLDSVIGVFLTQNVSDHLSSSAFISMAARFPLESSSHHHHTQSCEKRITKGPEVSDPDDQKVSSQLACLQDSITLGDKKYTGEEVIDAKDIFGNTSEDTKITKNSKSPSSDASEYGPKLYNEPDVNKFDYWNNETLANFNGDQRESDDVISSQNSVVSSHNSADSTGQTANKTESCSQSSTEAEPTNGVCGSTSFVKLLQMAETTMLHGVYNQGRRKRSSNIENPTNSECMACNSICVNSGYQEARDFDPSEDNRYCDLSKENELSVTEQSGLSAESSAGASYQNMVVVNLEEVQKLSSENNNCLNSRPVKDLEIGQESNAANSSECILSVTGRIDVTNETRNQKIVESNLTNCSNLAENEMNPSTSKSTRGRNGKEKKNAVDWDKLRKQAFATGKRRERTANTMDSVDWEAVRCANVEEIAQTIKERGMNNMLAERIKDFLNRIVKDHGSIDLEWLRDVPPDSAKEFLLSVRGLGLKSVECVRLLTLHHLAFPVDTNVGRIAVRLGWVPLQPLPESLQLHLLELYPVLESIQKYLWPRLCKLDQRTLYELHYQMITFGKVFCTKSKPNCNSCPMRGECRHFASAFASARLALPAPEEKSIVSVTETKAANRNRAEKINHLQLPLPQASQQLEARSQVRTSSPIIEEPATPEPIVEVPATPEPEQTQVPEMDIEDFFCDDADEIPTIKLNMEELNQNLQNYIETNVLVQEGEMSKALVVLTPEAASIPTPKLKNISQLRTEHQVYELPDTHPLLAEFDRREPDDPSSYLLAIWTPGETVDSIQPPERRCSFQESGKLCDQETCFSCSSIREANSQTVRGTLLIPCRTAMRGSFPLNGTYFQVNEMFADYESSLNPIDVPRGWLWNLRRRTVYFGTSIPTIFKGLSQGEIQYCFWRGFVCVRGFDRKIRAPRPLVARLHFPASKRRGRTYES